MDHCSLRAEACFTWCTQCKVHDTMQQSASFWVQAFTGKGLQRPSILSLRSRWMLCCNHPLMTLLQQLQLLAVVAAMMALASNDSKSKLVMIVVGALCCQQQLLPAQSPHGHHDSCAAWRRCVAEASSCRGEPSPCAVAVALSMHPAVLTWTDSNTCSISVTATIMRLTCLQVGALLQ